MGGSIRRKTELGSSAVTPTAMAPCTVDRATSPERQPWIGLGGRRAG